MREFELTCSVYERRPRNDFARMCGAVAVLALACAPQVSIEGSQFNATGGAGGAVGSTGPMSSAGPMSSTGSSAGGSGGASVCTPGTIESCYDGPLGTVGVGECKAGTHTCLPDGSAFGPCHGAVTPTDDDCTTLDDENCDAIVEAGCGGEHLFTRLLDHAFPNALADGPQETLVVAGVTDIGTVDFGNGPQQTNDDVFVVKYDALDNVVFAKIFDGTASLGWADGVASDAAGGVVVTGSAEGTIDLGSGPLTGSPNDYEAFVARLDASGTGVWSMRPQTTDGESHGHAVAIDGTGSVYVAGRVAGGSVDFGGGPLPGGGNNDVFILKLDPAGNHVWSKRFGDAGSDIASGIAVDGANNVYVTGNFEGTIELGGPPLTCSGFTDVFLVKFDAAGNHLWSKRFGDPAIQGGAAVDCDAAGNVVMSGTQEGIVDYGGGLVPTSVRNQDVFAAAFDASGNHLWSDAYGGWSGWSSLALHPNGHAIIAGAYSGAMDFGGGTLVSEIGYDAFLAKLSDTGTHVWSKAFVLPGYQNARAVAAFPSGATAIAGFFSETINFGGGPTTVACCDQHGFIARFGP